MTRFTWTEETAKIAAQWWRNQLESPTFDNGDKSPTGGMAMAMAFVVHKPVTAEKLDAFERELVKIILDKQPMCLDCDYGPDMLLATAADNAGLNARMGTFPWKTGMSAYNGEISVRVGYGAPAVTLWPKTENT